MLLINLESRMKNKTFWIALLGAIVLLAQQCGIDASKFVPKNYVDIINTIFVILTILGIVVDPSTPGISDQTSQKSTSNIVNLSLDSSKFTGDIENIAKEFESLAKKQTTTSFTSQGAETTGSITIKDDSINESVQANSQETVQQNLSASSKIAVDVPVE